MKPRIAISIPWIKVNQNHMEHFTEWYALNFGKYDFRRLRTFYRATHQAQARALHVAREEGCSHILFTEDDQWGYPQNGLDVLLEADKDVIGYQTYFKEFPWNPMNCRKKRPEDSLLPLMDDGQPKPLLPFERGRGPEVQKTDLITWAFTLVKIDVFDRMTEAGLNPFLQWGPHPTDSFFCEYCDRLGIDRYVHFGTTIAHGDLAPSDREYARQLHDDKHPTATTVTLRDDHGNPFGTVEHVPQMEDLKQHFAGGGRI